MRLPLRQRLTEPLLDRRDAGLKRELRAFDPGEGILNLANNDYLDLANDPRLAAAANQAIDRYGCSASASPLITGYGPVHEELLEALMEWHGFDHGLIWNSGYVANKALLKTLPRKGDLVLADRLIHNSMLSGILGSGARLMRYRHGDVSHLEELLEKNASGGRVVFVATESVFSMDGDYPDLAEMAALKKRYGFFWIVDEAHALGWYGQRGSGLVEHCGVGEHVDALVGTLGKALGSMGAYTLFQEEIVAEHLANFADEFVYSTYLAPSCAAAATAAIGCIQKSVRIRASACRLSLAFRKRLVELGFGVALGDSPIVSIPLGEPDAALRAARFLEARGIRVGVARPPTVPEGTSRLRVSLKANVSQAAVDRVIEALKEGVRA